MNVFLLSSISDATLMLDFCEVQHLKLNLSEALVATAVAKLLGVSFLLSFFLCASGVKEKSG